MAFRFTDAVSVAAGAALGGVARMAFTARRPASPSAVAAHWRVARVNIAGAFALGALSAFAARASPTAMTTARRRVLPRLPPRTMLLFLGTGFCGGFTTFSTYALDTIKLFNEREYAQAALYVLVSNVGGIIAAMAGSLLVPGQPK